MATMNGRQINTIERGKYMSKKQSQSTTSVEPVKKTVSIDRSAFLDTVKAMANSSPAGSMSAEQALDFRNRLLVSMSEGVHTSFEGRLGSKTTAKNMYETACNLTLMIMGEQLPAQNKINVEEQFEDNDNDNDNDDDDGD